MKGTTRIGVALALAAVCGGRGLSRAGDEARTARTPHGLSEERARKVTATVTAVDREARKVTIADDGGGQPTTIDVPDEVKGLDRIKVGDRIDVEYVQSAALTLETGAAAGKAARTTSERTFAEPGDGITSNRRVQVRAEVVAVNAGKHQLTLRGPEGNTRTLTIEDPDLRAKLATIKPGDSVAVVYSEAVAARLAPAEER
jgi:Cu/Ag efflux protein CusF